MYHTHQNKDRQKSKKKGKKKSSLTIYGAKATIKFYPGWLVDTPRGPHKPCRTESDMATPSLVERETTVFQKGRILVIYFRNVGTGGRGISRKGVGEGHAIWHFKESEERDLIGKAVVVAF